MIKDILYFMNQIMQASNFFYNYHIIPSAYI